MPNRLRDIAEQLVAYTHQPEATRDGAAAWLERAAPSPDDWLQVAVIAASMAPPDPQWAAMVAERFPPAEPKLKRRRPW